MPPGPFATIAGRYFEVGLSVIPIVPGGKKPAVPWRAWQRRRQTETELGWLADAHGACDVGIILSGLVDIETDGPVGERMLIVFSLPVPPTAIWSSPRGHHRLFRCDQPLRTRRALRPQLDVLGAGSYVVAPTSGGRAWLTSLYELAPLPTAWEDFLRAMQRPEEWRQAARDGVEEGARNTSLAALTGSWLTQRVSEVELMARAAAFARRCRPPIPAEEVARTVASIRLTRQRARPMIAEALLAAAERRLDATTWRVLMGVLALHAEVGLTLPAVAAPHRLVASYAGVDRDSVGPALRRLEQAGVVRLSRTRDPATGWRRVTVVEFLFAGHPP